MLDFLKGKKTYLVAILMVVHALSGWALGKEVNWEEVLMACGLAALRGGVAKGQAFILLCSVGAMPLLSGCALLPGADPVVVRAEQATAVAVEIFHAFLKFELDNRAALAGTPEIRAAAERIGERGPDLLETARALTKAYKANRTADNKVAMETITATLEALAQEAQAHLARAGAGGK
jgi:hypothetical protein